MTKRDTMLTAGLMAMAAMPAVTENINTVIAPSFKTPRRLRYAGTTRIEEPTKDSQPRDTRRLRYEYEAWLRLNRR